MLVLPYPTLLDSRLTQIRYQKILHLWFSWYDFKLYLLIGAIIFVIILVSTFISSVYEQIASIISDIIKDFIANKLQNSELNKLDWIIRVVIFIPLANCLIDLLQPWLNSSVDIRYKGLTTTILLFVKIYVTFSLIFQNKRYSSSMNLTNFILILIALTVSLYAGRFTLEEYLLKDAKLIYNHNEKLIEVILINNGTIYYKENSTYKCEILKDDITIEFTK